MPDESKNQLPSEMIRVEWIDCPKCHGHGKVTSPVDKKLVISDVAEFIKQYNPCAYLQSKSEKFWHYWSTVTDSKTGTLVGFAFNIPSDLCEKQNMSIYLESKSIIQWMYDPKISNGISQNVIFE